MTVTADVITFSLEFGGSAGVAFSVYIFNNKGISSREYGKIVTITNNTSMKLKK